MAKKVAEKVLYKAIALMNDGEHGWPVVIGRNYKSSMAAEKAGYAFVKKYSSGLPTCCGIQVLEADHVSIYERGM